MPMHLIGITGKSGSGKSTLAKWLADNAEYFLIDVDEIGHQILDIPEVQKEILMRFGVHASSDNRKELAMVVFNDENKMLEYKDMTYKIMCDKIDQLIDAHPYCIIEWIKLPNTKYFDMCDVKVLCERPYDKRMAAVMERDHITKEYFEIREKNSIEYNRDDFDHILIINK